MVKLFNTGNTFIQYNCKIVVEKVEKRGSIDPQKV